MPFTTIPQTSFIPKKTLSSVKPRDTSSGINFFLIVALLLFLASIIIAGLVFGWRLSLEKGIKSSEDFIINNEKSFDTDLLDTVTKTNQRLITGNEILSKHISVSKIFEILQGLTLQTVRFKNFAYTLDDKGDIKITMTGEGETFNSIALQSDELNKTDKLKNPVMSNFSLSDTGSVSFSLTATVPIDLVLFKEKVQGE
ncbi:MAG: hypothetical protein Q7R78_02330 [bacterium]|nr:hypothetical protein [bacterium]